MGKLGSCPRASARTRPSHAFHEKKSWSFCRLYVFKLNKNTKFNNKLHHDQMVPSVRYSEITCAGTLPNLRILYKIGGEVVYNILLTGVFRISSWGAWSKGSGTKVPQKLKPFSIWKHKFVFFVMREYYVFGNLRWAVAYNVCCV